MLFNVKSKTKMGHTVGVSIAMSFSTVELLAYFLNFKGTVSTGVNKTVFSV
jgi:hypothetical protein